MEMLIPPARTAAPVLFKAISGSSLGEPPRAPAGNRRARPGGCSPPRAGTGHGPGSVASSPFPSSILKASSGSSARPPCLHFVWAGKPQGKTGAALCRAVSGAAGGSLRPGGLRRTQASQSKGGREAKTRWKMAWEGQSGGRC